MQTNIEIQKVLPCVFVGSFSNIWVMIDVL